MASVIKTLKALPKCDSVADLQAALDALPDEPCPWTPEHDALLCTWWGKKQKALLMPLFVKLTGRSPHAIECRTVQLRAEGRDIGRYVAKKRR